MESQVQDQIESILNRIHSLDDLSADDVFKLRQTEGSLVIDKFNVSPTEYQDWLEKVGDDIRGVEYDAQNACLVLKKRPGWMHETTAALIGEFLGLLRNRLNAATDLRYFSTASKRCSLAGDFDRSSKEADASLMELDAQWPAVVLEVGISETTKKLYKDAERWLEGSNNQTKLVILVDIQETGKRNASNDTWELSEVDFQQTNHARLSNDIFQWYRSNGISPVGGFRLSVHLWYSDGDRQCILNNAAFSPGNLIDLTTINDVPLRLEHLMPSGSNFDAIQHLLFPLRLLVDTLQNGLRAVERERASNLAEDRLRR